MFQKEFLILCSLAAGVFLLVAAAGFWVGHTIREDADKIALDTLPGLVDAGDAMALAQDNWHRVHLLSNAQSAAEQAVLMEQIRINSNEGIWRDYTQSVYTPEERKEYRELLSVRSHFLQLREEFFTLVETGRLAEAKIFLTQKLTPANEAYREASRTLFEYNARVGRERAAKVIWISRAVPLILAACGGIIFVIGLAVGLKGALGGLHLVSRGSKP